MAEYTNIIKACRILSEKRLAVSNEDGPSFISPAFRMLLHATDYLRDQADAAMRGECAAYAEQLREVK